MGSFKELVIEMNDAIQDMYHNATLGGSLITESDYESDLYESHFEIHKKASLEELGELFPELISVFGDIYQYGRGGRTVMPSGLITYGGGPRWRIKRGDELDQNLITKKNIELIKDFNTHVKNWCKKDPDYILAQIRKDFKKEIAKNAGKKRVTRTITEYK